MLTLLTAFSQTSAQENNPHVKIASVMLGKTAPAWNVEKWFNTKEGKALNPSDFKGKVVYLYCFQSWCPGCHSHGFPALQKLVAKYQGDDKVAFVAVQAAFEGFKRNTAKTAQKAAKKYNLSIPIGHSGSPGNKPAIMTGYKTGGTPWVIIIGPDGKIRYSQFHIGEANAEKLINSLKK